MYQSYNYDIGKLMAKIVQSVRSFAELVANKAILAGFALSIALTQSIIEFKSYWKSRKNKR